MGTSLAGVLMLVHAMLCMNGHPVQRSPHVTYGHRHCPVGTVRDHIVPLCLGGPDAADNIQCQPREPSYAKDKRERAACDAYCAGEITIDQARGAFHREYK